MSRSTGRLLAFTLCLLTPFSVQAIEVLRVLTWPGYADGDFVKAFEQRYKVRVEVTFVSSDDQLRDKLQAQAGANFDVFAANTAEIENYVDQALVAPITPSQISNIARQLPRFRAVQDIPGIYRDGKVFAVPYTYAEMGVIYDRKQVREPPTSLSVLWDPVWQGKVLAFNDSTHNFSISALTLGLPPFRIADTNFPKVIQQLIALRRNVLTFYALPEESVELFRKHNTALMFANYGSQQVKLLRDAGADVGYVIPKEGTLAWLDCWAISRKSMNMALAEKWINYMLDPEVSHALTTRQGLANTIEAGTSVDATAKLLWLEPVEDQQRRHTLWRRIFSGERPGKF